MESHTPATVDPLAAVPQNLRDGLVELWLSGRTRDTLATYRRSLAYFTAWLGMSSAEAAVERLLGGGPGQANILALLWESTKSAERSPRIVQRRSRSGEHSSALPG